MLEQFKIGHFTDLIGGTGCTIILPPKENIASACVRGAYLLPIRKSAELMPWY